MIPITPIISAVFHGSELSLIFGPVPNPVENDFANQLTDYWINFVNDMNPGGMEAFRLHLIRSSWPPIAGWPQFELKSKPVLQLLRDNITVILDGSRHSSHATYGPFLTLRLFQIFSLTRRSSSSNHEFFLSSRSSPMCFYYCTV